jgi:hypothetical protein
MNHSKYLLFIGLVLFSLVACGTLSIPATQLMPTTTPVQPIRTAPLPTQTATPIQPTSTTIPPTVPPETPTTTNVQVEQASAFADPILTVIANYPPHFEDDFSTSDKGWEIWLLTKEGSAIKQDGATRSKEGFASIQDGVARSEVIDSKAHFDNANLNRKDFVLQMDIRFMEGDSSTTSVVHFHVVGAEYWFSVELSSFTGYWGVSKKWGENQQTDFNVDRGNVNPIGEWMQVMVVARGPRAAVYLNGEPVAYFEDADFDRLGHISLTCNSITQAVCEFDNVEFWDLAKVPGLP